MKPAPKPKLKMWTGNLDGRRQGLVIASSKKRASEVVGWNVGSGLTDFNRYWREQPIDESLDPEVLYTRPFDSRGPWFAGRCAL
ncbi:MAG: hypothetical protein IMZ46_07845 [Acidobacteria bacterium]|nr:hypothetical protein [Acidobacteriota bacterium]